MALGWEGRDNEVRVTWHTLFFPVFGKKKNKFGYGLRFESYQILSLVWHNVYKCRNSIHVFRVSGLFHEGELADTLTVCKERYLTWRGLIVGSTLIGSSEYSKDGLGPACFSCSVSHAVDRVST